MFYGSSGDAEFHESGGRAVPHAAGRQQKCLGVGKRVGNETSDPGYAFRAPYTLRGDLLSEYPLTLNGNFAALITKSKTPKEKISLLIPLYP